MTSSDDAPCIDILQRQRDGSTGVNLQAWVYEFGDFVACEESGLIFNLLDRLAQGRSHIFVHSVTGLQRSCERGTGDGTSFVLFLVAKCRGRTCRAGKETR